MNLQWYNRAKVYCQKIEDPGFFKTFDWLNVDLGLKDTPITKEWTGYDSRLPWSELEEVERNIKDKWGDL